MAMRQTIPFLRLQEAVAYSMAARKADPLQVRTLIFAQGRTGSTLLEQLLCATGQFRGYGELLGQVGSAAYLPMRFIDGHARLASRRHFVCHVKLYHLTRDRLQRGRAAIDPAHFLQELSARGYRVVFLRRDNLVRQVVSNRMARVRGSFHKTDDRPETTTLHVEREYFHRRLEKRESFALEERRALAGVPHLEIVYENDLEQPALHQRTTDRIMRYLGLPSAPVAADVRKINTRPLSEIVANYDEVRRWAIELGRERDL